ncbi:MAG: hypothetical protein V1811_01665 [Candidatus Micrarchaeota archaeon]
MAERENQKINALFHFTMHASPEDVRETVDVLHEFKPHVVCQEAALLTEKQAQALERTSEFFAGSPFNVHLARHVQGIGAKLWSLERFSESESRMLFELNGETQALVSKAHFAFLQGSPDEALKLFGRVVKQEAKFDSDREREVKNNLANLQAALLKAHPELAEEKEIRVLIVYGNGHNEIYRHAKSIGMKTARTRSYPGFDQSALVRQKVKINPEKEPAEEELAKSIVNDLVQYYACHLTGFQNLADARRFTRMIVKKVNLERFRTISQTSKSNLDAGKSEVQALLSGLEEAGLPAPRTPAELNSILKKT